MTLLALLHRWTGGIVGLLLVVIALSGTVLLWEGAWISLPGAADPVQRDPSALGATIEAALAIDPTLSRITFASEEIGLHQAVYADGSGAYFNQAGEIVDRWSSMWGRPELWLFELHHYLFLGETGKIVTGVLGLLLIAFTFTGAILWWRTRRTFRFRLWPARMTRSAIVRQHRDLGVVASPLLLIVAMSGSLMVFPALSAALLSPWTEPDQSAPAPPEKAAATGPQTDWRRLMNSAQAAFPDAAPRRLMMPGEEAKPVVLRLRQDFEWTPNGRTYVYLDPASLQVLATDDPALRDTASAIAEKFYPVHSGKIGGFFWQLVLTFAGSVLALLGTLATWSFWASNSARRPDRVSRSLVPAD